MTSHLPEMMEQVVTGKNPASVHNLQLDGTKIGFYRDRVQAWQRGERIAPITMDVAWTRKCAAACNFCIFPDSQILMADGSTKRMIDVHVGDAIVSIDENGKNAVSTVTAHWQTSLWTRGLQLETRFAKLKCTASHLIGTDNGWVAAGDLRVGGYVQQASYDRGRKTTSAREEPVVAANAGSGALARETTPIADSLQQDQSRGTAVAGSSQSRQQATHSHQQDQTTLGSGTSGDCRTGADQQCGGQVSTRRVERTGKGNSSSADARQHTWSWQQNERGSQDGGFHANEAKQSNEERASCREDAGDNGRTAWGGLFVAVVQKTVARRSYQGQAAFGSRKSLGECSHESRQSNERPGGCCQDDGLDNAGTVARGFGTNEKDVGGRQNHSVDVYGERQRQGSQPDRTEDVSDTALLRRSVRRQWDVLDWRDSERDSPQPGFHIRQQYGSESEQDGVSGAWDVLASGRGTVPLGNRRLQSGWMEPVRSLDAPHIEMDVAADQGGSEIVVGRGQILSITDAGYSPVYDLECRPYHNFVADGIVVHNCYAQLQASEDTVITRQHAFDYLDDAAEIGVKGVSLISDGESTEVPYFTESVEYGAKRGLQIGTSSNGVKLTPAVLERILPNLTYIRFNFSGGDRHRWAQIMGLKQALFDKVVSHIKAAMEIKRRDNLPVNINMQFVVLPKDADQILPFAKLAKEIRPDYAIMKHCANSADNDLDVDYRHYSKLFPLFEEAEALSDETFRVAVKWSRIQDEGKRDYQRCYGPPFILQMSGNGLIAPCGQKFNSKYAKFHIGNITRTRFRDIYQSDRYWEVLRYLASDEFDASTECGENCLQTNSNSWLDKYVKGTVQFPDSPAPPHMGFL